MADVQLDVCGLQPPAPMEKVLDALSQLAPDDRLVMLIDREPRPLYRILANNGYRYQAESDPDGQAGLYRVLIWQQDRESS